MADDPHDHDSLQAALDNLKASYRVAVEAWIAAIRQEEALVAHVESVQDLDNWESAHFHEDDLRGTVKAAKKEYENALRKKFFRF